MLSGYMGKSDAFDKAIAAFAMAYADQNERDHAALDRAVRKGKVKAVFEEEPVTGRPPWNGPRSDLRPLGPRRSQASCFRCCSSRAWC